VDQLLGHAAQTLETAHARDAQVGHRASEGEDRVVGTRVGQAQHETEGSPLDTPAHRHHDVGVPPLELADLAGQVARALEGPCREEARTHPSEVRLEDADATGIAGAAQVVEDDRGGCLGIPVEQRRDLLGVGIDERAP
jgi:hypothetical protein